MRIVAATRNKKKAAEMKEILTQVGITDVITLDEAGVVGEVEETGETFSENALIKARAAFEATGMPSIADDSGLAVDVLGGEPGVYSARYASTNGENADDDANTEKLLEKLKGVPENERTARFVSAIAYIDKDGNEITVIGKCEGIITGSKRGDGGFGYDPVFFYPPFGKTFGEMSEAEKNTISHRAAGIKALCEKLKNK